MVINNHKVLGKRIRISELARVSGVSKSSIYNYLNMGLLHPPEKLGLSLSGFDSSHVNKLRRIRELRKCHKLPLSEIRQVLLNGSGFSSSVSQQNVAEVLISTLEEERNQIRARKDEMRRIEIMNAAIGLFSQNGYEGTTLETIADTLHMAKSALYRYFESKEDLFLECIERLTVVVVPEEAWDEIRKEKNSKKRVEKRITEFLKAFPGYKGILTMTKAALTSENLKLAEKANNTLIHMTRYMAKDLHRGITNQVFREIDEDLVAHFILGISEALGCRLMVDSKYTLEEGIRIMMDILFHGIAKYDSSKIPGSEPNPCSGEITDLKE